MPPRFASLGQQIRQIAGERSAWILAIMLAVLALLHYLRPELVFFPVNLGFLQRHAVDRIIFLLPVGGATFAFGQTGGLITLGIAILIMLPRVFWVSLYPADALVETLAVGVVGYLVSWMIGTQEREKRLRQEAVSQLRMINAVGSIVTKSLELEQVLNGALDAVLEMTRVVMGFIFLIERGTQDLVLTAQRGLSPEFSEEIKRLKMGQSLSGWVAQTGQPRVVENLLQEHQLTTSLASEARMRSFIAVPLMSRGRVMGVMDLADPQHGRFTARDVELLMAVGNEIGVAVENAHLYENMRYYAQMITRAQEDERARIARELHDDTIQSLIVLSRRLEALASFETGSPPARAQRLEELRRITDAIIQGVRRFSQDLRPSILDDLGLLPALDGLATSMTEHDGIHTRLWVLGKTRRLTPEMELTLFRITQEALTNVKKHAGASQVLIIAEFTGSAVQLTIQDNGKGFTLPTLTEELAASGQLGLIGMHERARLLGGTLLMQSQVGLGTKVVVTVPATPPSAGRDKG